MFVACNFRRSSTHTPAVTVTCVFFCCEVAQVVLVVVVVADNPLPPLDCYECFVVNPSCMDETYKRCFGLAEVVPTALIATRSWDLMSSGNRLDG